VKRARPHCLTPDAFIEIVDLMPMPGAS